MLRNLQEMLVASSIVMGALKLGGVLSMGWFWILAPVLLVIAAWVFIFGVGLFSLARKLGTVAAPTVTDPQQQAIADQVIRETAASQAEHAVPISVKTDNDSKEV